MLSRPSSIVGGTGIPHLYALVRGAIEKQVTHRINNRTLVAHQVSFVLEGLLRVIGS